MHPNVSLESRILGNRRLSEPLRLTAVCVMIFVVGKPQLLFDKRVGSPGVSPDGQRFLVILPAVEQPLTQINIVTRWAEELK